jgi:hypothetical protein
MSENRTVPGSRIALNRSDLPAIIEAASKAPKPTEHKVELTTRDVVAEVWPSILALKRRGYKVREIAEFLVAQGVRSSVTTVHTAISRESGKRTRKPAKSHASGGTKPATVRVPKVPVEAAKPAVPVAVPEPKVLVPDRPPQVRTPLVRGGKAR